MTADRTGNGQGLIGLDIGATKTLGVLVDADGRVLAQAREATEPGADGVIDTAARVVADLGGEGVASSVGVGIPGLVDHVGGEVQHAVNLGLNGDRLALRVLLEGRCALPVHVENDVNAATLGAVALSGIRDLVYLSIGTGLAAGIAIDGILRRGATGAAGEIGHVPVDPAGALCQCGQRGCLETIASGSAISLAWPSGDQPAAQALFDRGGGRGPRCGRGPGPVRGGRRRRRAHARAQRRPADRGAGRWCVPPRAGPRRRGRRRATRAGELVAVPRVARPRRAGSGWCPRASPWPRSERRCWVGHDTASSRAWSTCRSTARPGTT